MAIDVIEDWGLDFLLGNVLKYIQRAGKKNPKTYVEDLQKARTYLSLKLERLEKKESQIESAQDRTGSGVNPRGVRGRSKTRP